MAEAGIGISAMVAIGSKFIERSKFTVRHDTTYDKEENKSIKLAERFDNIPREDVDHFEFEEYTKLRAQYVEQYLTERLLRRLQIIGGSSPLQRHSRGIQNEGVA